MDKDTSNASIKVAEDMDESSKAPDLPEEDSKPPARTSPSDRDPSDSSAHHHHHPSPRRHHHHHHHHQRHRSDNLDEDTLQRIKTYLESGFAEGTLDENAIGNRMARMARAAQDEVRYRLDMSDDSEDERERVTEKVYDLFEDQSIAQDFYKKVVSETQKHDSRPLDKRTMTWIRRAIGLHRRPDFWEPHHHGHHRHYDLLGALALGGEGDLEDSEDEHGEPRRKTRGMVRSSRIAKSKEKEEKDNMGLNALMAAVDQLEEERGPFAGHRRRGRPRKGEKGKRGRPPKGAEAQRAIPITAKSPAPSTSAVPNNGKPKQGRVLSPLVPMPPRTNRPIPSYKEARKKRRKTEKLLETEEEEENISAYLMGPIDPSSIYKDKGHLDTAESLQPPVTLSLLEWRRRNPRGLPGTSNLPGVDVPAALAASKISAALPNGSAVNPIPQMQRNPSLKEPTRRRHSDSVYAAWCTRMINSLKGSGRSWAHHEFFYSDIDRAWFNYNEFQADVVRLGIPPGAKMTRREWSLVRRSIPNRPRRFSKRFVQKQMAQLETYRQKARWAQKNKCRPPDFRYEVPAVTKVGSTVSAFNKRFHIIHRGLVLSYEEERHGYMIMFERKELGFEFCRDVDVASHGVPEILIPAADITLNGLGLFSDINTQPGELPYGTSYGPVFGKHDRDDESRSLLWKLMAREINLLPGTSQPAAAATPTTNTPSAATSDPAFFKVNEPNQGTIEEVAERETCVRLAAVISAAMQRKTRILETMEMFVDPVIKNVQGDALDELKDHFAWLQANLQLTTRCLESALLYVQLMYNDIYAGILLSLADKNSAESTSNDQLLALNEPNVLEEKYIPNWATRLSVASSRLADAAVKKNSVLNTLGTLGAADKQRCQHINQQLAAAYRLLLSTDYCSSLMLGEKTEPVDLVPSTRSIGAFLSVQADKLSPKDLPLNAVNQVLSSLADSRALAFRELQEAVAGLETEMKALHAARQLTEDGHVIKTCI